MNIFLIRLCFDDPEYKTCMRWASMQRTQWTSILGPSTDKNSGWGLQIGCPVDIPLERKGTPIGVNDLHIAGHARNEGLTLVTNNLKEFDRVEGLRLENWV